MADQVVPGLWRIGLGGVNAYLVGGGEATLVDTGVPKRGQKIASAVRAAGRRPEDIRHVAITHYHVDHIGSLAAVLEMTQATVYAHPNDADVIREGREPPMPSVSGPAKAIMPVVRLFFPKSTDPAPVGHEVKDGEELLMGMQAVHTPGHTPGHVSYLWPEHGGVLIVGDAAWNLLGRLSGPRSYEDLETAQQSVRRMAELDFEIAVFGHGSPIKGQAATQFRKLVERRAS